MEYHPYGEAQPEGSSHRLNPPQPPPRHTTFPRDEDPTFHQGAMQQWEDGAQLLYTPYQFTPDPTPQPYQPQQPVPPALWEATPGGLPAIPQYALSPGTAYQQQEQHQYYRAQASLEHQNPLVYQPPPLPDPPFLSAYNQPLNPSTSLFHPGTRTSSPTKSASATPHQRGSLSSGNGGSSGDGDGEESSGNGRFFPSSTVSGVAGVGSASGSGSGSGPTRASSFGPSTSAAKRGSLGTAAATIRATETGGSSAGSGSGGASPAVAALAAGIGPRTTEKSCKNCRLRKVKCDRQWPRCNRCKQRDEDCSFGTFVPVDVIPASALQTAVASTSGGGAGQGEQGERVAELQERIRSLGAELEASRADSAPQVAQQPALLSGLPAEPGGAVPSDSTRSFPAGPIVVGRQPAPFPNIEGLPGPPQPTGGEEGEQVSQSTLSESIRSAFSSGAGLGPSGGVGQTTFEHFLRSVAQSQPDYYRNFAPNLVSGVPMTASSRETAFVSFEGGGGGEFEVPGLAPYLSEKAPDWRIARKEMGRVLVIHLVQSFFASCCAYLPPFHGCDDRRPWILSNIDNLDPASRVAVAAFCAMGARASPHSALLGIPFSSPSPTDSFAQASAAGMRREQACRALHTQAMDLMHVLGITLDATKENLEAMMVMAQMLIFNELVPRRSRSMVHSALGHFKELQESSLPPDMKDDLLRHVGLPLLTCDAITSAYARKKPLITEHDLEVYFPNFVTANFEKQNIQAVLQGCLRQHSTAEGLLSHEGIGRAAAVVHSWIAQSQRMFAKAAAPVAGGPPDTLLTQIRDLWKVLDEIHEGIRKLQEMLVHLSYVPHGCASDGCADQHLRFVTRLDKDLIDIFFLINTLVSENLGLDSLVGEEGQRAYAESNRRVRKALKLVAFYSELYITSRDPHMTYHVVWQLEVLPNWTTIVVQRHGEPGGPATADLEVSETELDWFTKGLIAASFYHPVAISRLQELQQSRRPAYPYYSSLGEVGDAGAQEAQARAVAAGSGAAPPAPFVGPSQASSAARSQHAGSGQQDYLQQQSAIHDAPTTTTQQYFSSTAAGETREVEEVNTGGGRVPAENPDFTFQGGHTGVGASKEWGQWDAYPSETPT